MQKMYYVTQLMFLLPGIYLLATPVYAVITIPIDYPTIQEGLDNAASGEIVLVQPGTYNEHIIFNINKVYDLQGVDPNTTIIDGSGSGEPVTIETTGRVNISNLTIKNSNRHGIYINGLDFACRVYISQCTVTNNPTDGIHLEGGECCPLDIYKHPYNQYISISDSDLTDNDRHGCFFHYVPTLDVHGCDITHNVEHGIHFEAQKPYYWSTSPVSVTIRANRFSYNDEALFFDPAQRVINVVNNTFEHHSTGVCYVSDYNGPEITFDGNVIQNNSCYYIVCGDSKYSCYSPTFVNNLVTGNNCGQLFANTVFLVAENNVITHNFFYDITDLEHYYSMHLEISFRNNYLYDNTMYFLFKPGIEVQVEIINNTFHDNTFHNAMFTYTPVPPGLSPVEFTIINNIICGNKIDDSTALSFPSGCPDARCEFKNNDIYNNSDSNIYFDGIEYADVDDFNLSVAAAEGNISCDADFVMPGDYHLSATSCCIDTGLTVSAITSDLEGDLRPFGAGYDIGADEYRPSTVPAFESMFTIFLLVLIPFVYTFGRFTSLTVKIR